VWDATSAEVKHVLLGHDKPVSSVFISKDAKYIISGSKEREPITWEYKTGNEVTPLSGHKDVINDVCFSPYIKFPEKKTMSKMDLFEEIKGDLIEAQPDALEEEIVRLEMELAAMEAQKVLGYDPTLLDSDVYDKKELKIGQKIILERIYFDFDKSDIRNESVVELNKLLLFLEKNSTVIVEISGHTDSRGSDEYNLKLSKNRAKSVVAWLKKRKMSSKRVIAKGYGESKHIAPNENPDGTDNPEGRQMNRRIELTIIGVGGEQIITTEGK
jgi:outer membrane protein OmpA-like peptidoglycan-associated protein